MCWCKVSSLGSNASSSTTLRRRFDIFCARGPGFEPSLPRHDSLPEAGAVLRSFRSCQIFFHQRLHKSTNLSYLCGPLGEMSPKRAVSSVGLEHLVYTEGVGGSSPSLPTRFPTKVGHLSRNPAFSGVAAFFLRSLRQTFCVYIGLFAYNWDAFLPYF